MKIAIIQPRTPYYVGGSEKVSIKQAEFLASQNHEVDYYTSAVPSHIKLTDLYTEFLKNINVNINIIQSEIPKELQEIYLTRPDPEHVRWITESLAFDRAIYEKIQLNKPDLILSYYLPDNLFKPDGIPNVIYISGYPSNEIPWYKAFMRFCTASISISSIVSQKWKNYTCELRDNFNLSTGVDYPLIINAKIQTNTRFNLVFAGRLIERKGLKTLLESFKAILNVHPDTTLWVLGDGDQMNVSVEYVREINLFDNVKFTGMVNNPYDYFNIADICIFPSYSGDGLMGTVLESMAAGKAIVCTTNNGNEDVIESGLNGILVEPKKPEEISKSVIYLLDNEDIRLEMGRKAQNFIEKNLTWEKHTERLVVMFEKIIAGYKNRAK